MAHYVHESVPHGPTYLRLSPNGSKIKRQRQLQLSPSSGPFKLIAIDMLGQIPRTKSGSHLMVIITDQGHKLIRTNPTPKIRLNHIANIFLNSLISHYGIPDIILSNVGQ